MTENPQVTDEVLKQFVSEIAALFASHRRDIDAKIDQLGIKIAEAFDKSSDKVVQEMRGLRQDLVPSATNTSKMDIKVVLPIIYTLCGVIGSLIIWFTGIKPFIPNLIPQQVQTSPHDAQ